jgi:putative acetyltransferase
MLIRRETSADVPAVRRVEERAFGRAEEAVLVDALRTHDRMLLSLVAEADGRVVGHVAFSLVTVGSRIGVGLAPLAVLPECQRRGVGAALVRRGLAECRAAGHDFAVVLGEPAYYARFGFEPAARHGVRCEFDAPEDAFMLLALRPGALAGLAGVARYAPEFGAVA